MKVFSGSSNPALARKIAQELKIKVGKIELSRFGNGECRVWIKEEVINSKAIIVQSFSQPPDENLIEFCLIADALKRLGVKKIISVIPWLGYCVQDKVFRPGEPLSSKVIARILQTLKISRIITLDLHNQAIAGFFDLPFTELFATYTFVDYFKKRKLEIDTIVSPDIGAFKKSIKFAQAFGLPVVTINKERDLATGKVSIVSVSETIKGKRVLIVDDFISTGGTLIQTIHYLKEKGVKKIYACLTHHFYIKGVQEKIEESPLDCLFVTDSIQKPNRVKYSKLKIVSIAHLISETIKKYQ
jgi:ribose-phosphate pyrophosphokinase